MSERRINKNNIALGQLWSIKKLAVVLALSLPQMSQPAAAAGELADVFGRLLGQSYRVTAAQQDKDAASSRVSETFRRAWTPTLELSGEAGKQRYGTNSVTTINTENYNVSRSTLRATQLLWDFGKSTHAVGEAENVAKQAEATSGATSDGVLLEALTAHWSVIRSKRQLDYSRQSEATVQKQTQLENSLVELGKGYASDVLQAKVQLATAEARRVRAEGALEIAQARVSAVFGKLTPDVKYDKLLFPKAESLPKSLEEAHAIALENNKQIQVGLYRSRAIQDRISSTTSKEFLPRLQVVAEDSKRHNTDGVQGDGTDRKVLLQLQISLNAAGLPASDAVKKDWDASVSREAETRDLVLEQVTIAWRNLLVARQNRDTLDNQVKIAGQFLKMASQERQMGRRSLLDVLTAEVSLINAQSDLATTEADIAIASLTLLQAIGKLDLGAIQEAPATLAADKVATLASSR